MEQLTPIYDTSVTDSVFALETIDAGFSQHESNRLLRQLMTSIDLHALLTRVFDTLQQKLNVHAVALLTDTTHITIGETENSRNIRTLDLSAGTDAGAQVHYHLPRLLNLREARVLQDVHNLAQHALINALEYQRVKQLAMKDALTGLGNRISYNDALQRQMSQARRHGTPFTLLLIDLDKFKAVNDNHGHQVGDAVLLAVAEVVNQSIRDTDYGFRLGGDEFCCLLTDSDEQDSQIAAERLQAAINRHPLLSQYGVSCSIGTTSYKVSDDSQTLFSRADKALYSAKDSGRNCIHVA